MWILWTNTFISTVLPVSGLTVCGWWHMMQRSMPMREPPWKESASWHLLQLAVRTTSRVLVVESLKHRRNGTRGGNSAKHDAGRAAAHQRHHSSRRVRVLRKEGVHGHTRWCRGGAVPPGPQARGTIGRRAHEARCSERRPSGQLHVEQPGAHRSEEHTSELQSLRHLVCRLLLEKK